VSGATDQAQTHAALARALQYTICDSPLGELLLLGDNESLHGLYMQDGPRPKPIAPAWERSAAPFARMLEQLGEYFEGTRVDFELSLVMHGTPFERRVWRALQEIPYGSTVSYGELARRIGRPSAPRAVGLANGRNPISVIVPCHRVIGANGTLTGYGGGLGRKRTLLALERRHARG
jgi:methylated-DNA-[protein]-cysteine S-methyltransferase